MTQLKIEIEKFVVANKEELVSNYLTKVCLQFKNELLELYNKKNSYDEMTSFILSLKYKYVV